MRAGVRFNEDTYLSFTYDADAKKVSIKVIDNNETLTGEATVTAAKKTTTKKATNKE